MSRDWIIPELAPGPGQMRAITVSVAAATGQSLTDMLSPKRTWDVARARQIAMHIARRKTNLSLPQIGRYFGRDHTTVLHGLRAVRERMTPEIAAAIETIEARISSPHYGDNE